MNLSDYNRWLRLARRHSRRPEDAQDLLQECLLIAFEHERFDFSNESNCRWFAGVLRNRGAMTARAEGRRRRREESTAAVELRSVTPVNAADETALARLLGSLPPAAAAVAVLALHGMNRDEIVSALNLSATSFRQRLTTIRRVVGAFPPEIRAEAIALAYQRRTERGQDLEIGLIRRALLHGLRSPREIGTHDPDGHLIIVGRR